MIETIQKGGGKLRPTWREEIDDERGLVRYNSVDKAMFPVSTGLTCIG